MLSMSSYFSIITLTKETTKEYNVEIKRGSLQADSEISYKSFRDVLHLLEVTHALTHTHIPYDTRVHHGVCTTLCTCIGSSIYRRQRFRLQHYIHLSQAEQWHAERA